MSRGRRKAIERRNKGLRDRWIEYPMQMLKQWLVGLA